MLSSKSMDHETAEEIKRHFNVVAEDLRSEIRTVAEGFIATNESLDRMESRMAEEFSEVKAMIRLSFGELDRRISPGAELADVHRGMRGTPLPLTRVSSSG